MEPEDLVRRQDELQDVWAEVKDRKSKHQECAEMVGELEREIKKAKARLTR